MKFHEQYACAVDAQKLAEWISQFGETRGFGRFTELTPFRSEVNADNDVVVFFKLGTQHYHDWLAVATVVINDGVMSLTVACDDFYWERGAESAYKWLIETMQDRQIIIGRMLTSFSLEAQC